ncbi:MAG: hypothetical protein RR842_09820 [Gordonibacter sp.]
MAKTILHAKQGGWATKVLAVLIVTGILPVALVALLMAACDMWGDWLLLVAIAPLVIMFARWRG